MTALDLVFQYINRMAWFSDNCQSLKYLKIRKKKIVFEFCKTIELTAELLKIMNFGHIQITKNDKEMNESNVTFIYKKY